MVIHRRTILTAAAAVILVLLFSGCATNGLSVKRTAADTQTDLSGRWNDTDARLTAEAMVEELLSRPWLTAHRIQSLSNPVVVVGEVRNLSSEHVNTDVFISDIERELINSGKVRFVAGSGLREQIRQERLDQQTQASEATISRLGAEIGADYMLGGSISSITDSASGIRAVLYKVTLELINIETNEKVWIGTKEIKKLIEQRKFTW
jgi:penicillin-binding protein activator